MTMHDFATAIQRGRRKLLRWVCSIFLVLCAISGCSDGQRVSHEDGDGPLSASRGSGGNVVYAPWDPRSGEEAEAPRSSEWQVSFGIGALCINDSDTESVEIESVDLHLSDDIPPADAELYIRRTDGERIDSQRGNAQHGPSAWSGEFTKKLAGTVISQSCTQAQARNGAERSELVLIVTSDEAGAFIDGASIDYQDGDNQYSLDIAWKWILCGDRTTVDTIGEELCDENA